MHLIEFLTIEFVGDSESCLLGLRNKKPACLAQAFFAQLLKN
jgi:hypothetical protein